MSDTKRSFDPDLFPTDEDRIEALISNSERQASPDRSIVPNARLLEHAASYRKKGDTWLADYFTRLAEDKR